MTGVVLLIGFYLLGELAAWIAELPIPGSIIGLLLLLLVLQLGRAVNGTLREGGAILLRLLPLFLVPIGVGVQQFIIEPRPGLLTLFLVNIAALIASVIVTAMVMRALLRDAG